ncbi:SurA N-terminal domain-containing protein [Verrucomicrobiota bacterium]
MIRSAGKLFMTGNLAIFALLIIAAFTLSGCKDKTPAPAQAPAQEPAVSVAEPSADTVIAAVGEVELTQGKLDKQINDFLSSPRMRNMPPSQMINVKARIRQNLIDTFITRTVLLNEINRLNIKADETKVEEMIDKIKEQIPPGRTLNDFLPRSRLYP